MVGITAVDNTGGYMIPDVVEPEAGVVKFTGNDEKFETPAADCDLTISEYAVDAVRPVTVVDPLPEAVELRVALRAKA
jgi:hypothetical protein